MSEYSYLEKKRLPNSRALIIMGVLSLTFVCCTAGLLSIPVSILGLIYAHKDLQLWKEESWKYSEKSKKNIQAGRVMCIIGLGMGLFVLSLVMYELISGTWLLLNWLTGYF